MKTPLALKLPLQGSGEPMDLWTTNDALPRLRLEVDRIEAQAILFDDPVNPLVSAAADHLTCILT